MCQQEKLGYYLHTRGRIYLGIYKIKTKINLEIFKIWENYFYMFIHNNTMQQ